MPNYNPNMEGLKPIRDASRAREMQAKGAETKRRNKAIREAMKLSQKELKEIQEEVLPEMLPAVDILKIQLAKAQAADDNEAIERLATALAEYEQPKLQRIDQATLSLETGDLSEEELEEQIRKLTAHK